MCGLSTNNMEVSIKANVHFYFTGCFTMSLVIQIRVHTKKKAATFVTALEYPRDTLK